MFSLCNVFVVMYLTMYEPFDEPTTMDNVLEIVPFLKHLVQEGKLVTVISVYMYIRNEITHDRVKRLKVTSSPNVKSDLSNSVQIVF